MDRCRRWLLGQCRQLVGRRHSQGTVTYSGAVANPSATLDGNWSVSGIVFGGSTAVTLNKGTGASLTLGASGINMASATANLTVHADIVAAASQTWNVSSGRTLAVSGLVSGASSITKDGAGTLILSGANTYTGVTTIRGNDGSNGEVRISSIGNGGVAGNLGAASAAAGNIVFGQSGVSTGKLVYTGSGESTDRLFTVNGHATLENNGTGALNFTNTGSLANVGGTQNLSLGGSFAGAANTLAAAIVNGSGTISVNKNGASTWTLSGASTYTGATSVNAGTLRLGSATALGATSGATTVVSGAVLDLNGQTVGAESLTLNGTGISASGALVNSSGTAASLAGNVTLGSATAIGGAGNITLSGVVSGANSLTKVGAGTLTLTGANTYSGGTTVGAGTLALSGAGKLGGSTGALAVNNAGVLDLGGTSQTVGAVTLGGGSVVNGTLVGTGFTSTGGVVSAALSGAGASLTHSSGVLTLSGAGTYSGATTVNSGRLNLTGSLTSAITVAGGATLSGSGSTTGNITFAAGAGILAGASGSVQGADVTLNAATNIFVSGAPTGVSQTVEVVRYTGAAILPAGAGPASNYRFGALADDTANKRVTLEYQAEERTWGGAAGTWDVGTGTTWALSGSDDRKFYWGDSVVFGNIGAGQTITLSGNLAPSSVTVANAANAYTFTGGGALIGTTGITKTGAGTLYINNSGTNSYTGGVAVQGGVLQVGVASGLGKSSSVVVSGGALLRYGNGASAAFTSSGHTVTLNDGAQLSIHGGSGAAVVTVADDIVLNSTGTAARIGGFLYGNSAVYSGSISGSGNLQITGFDGGSNGGVFLNGWKTNRYVGNTSVSGLGALTFQLGSVSNNDRYTPFGQVVGSTSGTATISGGQSVLFKMPGVSHHVYIDNHLVLDNATITSEDSQFHLAGNVHIGSGGAALRAHWDTKSLYVDGLLSGSGALSISTSSNNTSGVRFTNGANTYSGVITVNSSAAVLEHNTALQFATVNLATNNGLQFGAGVTAPVIGGLSGSANNGIAGVALTVGGANGTTAYSGVLSGNGGSLVKTGTGSLTLSGANTYTGGTTVNAGTLLAGGAGAFGTGAVTVNGGVLDLNGRAVANAILLAGGTLQGGSAYTGTISATSGTLLSGSDASKSYAINASGATFTALSGQGTFTGGRVTVSGSHNPGNSPGTQTFANGLTYGDGAVVNLEIASDGLTADSIVVQNGLTIGTGVTLNVSLFGSSDYSAAYWDTDHTYTLISATGGVTGSFSPLNNLLGSTAEGAWALIQDANGVVATWTATAIPEPSTYGLMGAGALAAAAMVRRRRRQAAAKAVS